MRTLRWLPWFLGALLPLLAAAMPVRAEEEIRVTVIAIIATDKNNEVNAKLKDVAAEVQKVEPGLTGFKIAWQSCKKMKANDKHNFDLVEKQVAEVTVKHGSDNKNKIGISVKPPQGGEITYKTSCGKFFPIITRYQTKDKDRLIIAISVEPCKD